eukprot:TRINITY_DN27706_c0_g1_i1.p1 TRINITY_DN27706_c0_g1~~TRINITY_DN27706_c0_g1_i1.p1  ORF type:complete len:119 (-),score=29.66 TRINITY_DN27706_c0_g1_i1:168-524(-)
MRVGEREEVGLKSVQVGVGEGGSKRRRTQEGKRDCSVGFDSHIQHTVKFDPGSVLHEKNGKQRKKNREGGDPRNSGARQLFLQPQVPDMNTHRVFWRMSSRRRKPRTGVECGGVLRRY